MPVQEFDQSKINQFFKSNPEAKSLYDHFFRKYKFKFEVTILTHNDFDIDGSYIYIQWYWKSIFLYKDRFYGINIKDHIVDVEDLILIKNCTIIELLSLENCSITDIQFIENLPNLNYLDLDKNNIKVISPLQKLTKLKQINFSYNSTKGTEFESLANLTNLEEVRFCGNGINNINWLEKLSNIKTLDLFNNQIQNIEPLKKLKKLVRLNLSYNDISDIGILKNLKGLEYLSLDQNGIKDLAPLEVLTNLVELSRSEERRVGKECSS